MVGNSNNHSLKRKQNQTRKQPRGLSRRSFLKTIGGIAAVTGAGALVSCDEIAPTGPEVKLPEHLPAALQYPEVPQPPAEPPSPAVLRFFTPHEARTADALYARLMPGSPADPGAREAGVVIYVDHLLATGLGYNEKTYLEPPFVDVYEGDIPPEPGDITVVWVPAEEIKRYGCQSMLTPRDVYRIGLAAVDRWTQAQYQRRYVDLSEEEQDQVIKDMLDHKIDTFEQFNGDQFFHILRRHVAEGMFSDPAYGGNREMAGWKLIGFPGAQRAYTPIELVTEQLPRAPQSLAMMPRSHPGQHTGPHVLLPVSGSNLRQKQDGGGFWPSLFNRNPGGEAEHEGGHD
jgi:gluconate 2-dehydrogenase gamma chain